MVSPGHRYKLTKLAYKVESSDDSWAAVSYSPNVKYIDISEDTVHDLGHLRWRADKKYSYSLFQSREADDIQPRQLIEEKYPDSYWLDYEFVPTYF